MTAKTSSNPNSSEFLEALDDVHSRFILNLPCAELSSSDRIFFQLEQAYWFYEDFYCSSEHSALPRYKNLHPFAKKMFEFSPLLNPLQDKFNEMWNEFTMYKRQISTYGTILLNENCDKIVLCLDYYGKSWTLPAGKINQSESGIEAAARETYEETGFDPHCTYGLTREMKAESSISWTPLCEGEGLVYTEGGKRRTAYVCRGVPDDFPFCPVARKEVSEVSWFEFQNLPKKNFAIMPFLPKLRRWIRKNTTLKVTALDLVVAQSKKSNSRPSSRSREDNDTRKTSNKNNKKSKSQPNSRSNSNIKSSKFINKILTKVDTTFQDENPGWLDIKLDDEKQGWTEKEMFSTNEKILGRKIKYDGNPHTFQDFLDPHRFHIVGGEYLNSMNLKKDVDKKTDASLFSQKESNNNILNILEPPPKEDGFEPFFSADGKTPWREVISNNKLLSDDVQKTQINKITTKEIREKLDKIETDLYKISVGSSELEIFQHVIESVICLKTHTIKLLKDKGIHNIFLKHMYLNQIEKLYQENSLVQDDYIHLRNFYIYCKIEKPSNNELLSMTHQEWEVIDIGPYRKQYSITQGDLNNDSYSFLLHWVSQLERPPPSKLFGEFKFDVDQIFDAMTNATSINFKVPPT